VLAREVLVAPALLAEPVDEGADGRVVRERVLAHVERDERETERRDRADGPLDDTVGGQLPAVRGEGVADEQQVVEQLAVAA